MNETGRYAITTRDRPLEVDERRCLICWSGEIEDETHFMLNCSVYEDLREKMFVVLQRTLTRQADKWTQQPALEIQKARQEEEGKKKLMGGLIGDLFADEQLKKAVLKFCKQAMRRRNNLVRTVLDQMT